MSRQRRATLDVLARLNRRATEEAAQAAAGLRAEEARLLRERDALLAAMEADDTPADAAAAPYRAAWMRDLSAEVQRLSAAAVRLRPEIDAAAARVAGAFCDLKSVETLQERAAETLRTEAEARRQEDLAQHLQRLPR